MVQSQNQTPRPLTHCHLAEVESTQDLLHQLLQGKAKEQEYLVSCNHQSAGRGRGDKKWFMLPHALAFSFTLSPHPHFLLSALEVAVLIAQFFQQQLGASLALKWPNDLLNEQQQKCGGILIDPYEERLVVGVGLNLWLPPEDAPRLFEQWRLAHHEYFYSSPGTIFPTAQIPPLLTPDNYKEQLPSAIVRFIHRNRILTAADVRTAWQAACVHHQKAVTITFHRSEFKTTGYFCGIDSDGQALIRNQEGDIETVASGSLEIIS